MTPEEKMDNVLAKQMAICSIMEQCRWIPVTERLPDIGQHVAALTAGGRRFVGYTATLYSRHCWIDRGNEVAVTHWMPLPAQPTDGK